MKIIFLDHDGVVCLHNNWGSRFEKERIYIKNNPELQGVKNRKIPITFAFDDFDGDAVSHLNKILEQTDAEIVVSSDWRLHRSLEEMQELYKAYGVNKLPIDYTPIYSQIAGEGEDYLPKIGRSRQQQRQFEIHNWLTNNVEKLKVSNWVSIDDMYLGPVVGGYNTFALDKVVTTSELIGLDKYRVEDAINILNNTN